MSRLLLSTTSLVWIVLIVATCINIGMADESRPALMAFGAVVIVSVAAIKIRLVIFHFMEIAGAPLPWRLFFDAWLLAVSGAVLHGYRAGLA